MAPNDENVVNSDKATTDSNKQPTTTTFGGPGGTPNGGIPVGMGLRPNPRASKCQVYEILNGSQKGVKRSFWCEIIAIFGALIYF